MKLSKIRTIVAAVVFCVLAICLVAGINMGTLSGFGWDAFSALCPLGAFTTMLATKTMVPRAVFSIIIMALLVFVFGRAFCGWICPVPVLDKVRAFFRSPKKRKQLEQAKHDEMLDIAKFELGCGGKGGDCGSCSACKQQRQKLDSRHYVLGGALLSTAIFGFPVFCLVCPIGLTFATILLLVNLFGQGDVTWSLIVVPALLIAEVVLFKKWCHKLCPLSAFMSLIAKLNRTFKPTIDDAKCLETSKGATCGRCGKACNEGIDPRHPELSEAAWSECTKCRSCVDACPANAITMPLIAKKGEKVTLAKNE